MPIVTTDMKNQPYRCDQCRQPTPVLIDSNDRRRLCLNCVPEKHRKVLGVPKGE